MSAILISNIVLFPAFKLHKRSGPERARSGGGVLAIKGVDLSHVRETVRALRLLDDQTILDPFNRRQTKKAPETT